MRAAGLISGTSLDGIDVAIVDVGESAYVDRGPVLVRPPTMIAFETVLYDAELRSLLLDAMPPNAGSVRDVCVLNALVGEAFATALIDVARRHDIALESIECIASHGHTLYHLPADDGAKPFARSTLQIGEASILVARTGITCVSDFRVADVAAGGHGAPLVPFIDWAYLRDAIELRAAVNIGGISNITVLSPGCGTSDVIAFDIGPGNMLIDAFARRATGGELAMDLDGRLAAGEAANGQLLGELLAHPFLSETAPKTTGREGFGDHYASRMWARGIAEGATPKEIVATATAAAAIAIARVVPPGCARIIVSGGGARNPTLMAMLKSELEASGQRVPIDLSDAFGLPADAKEAIAFAVLGVAALTGHTNNLPSATGAKKPAVMGKISPGKNFTRLYTGDEILV